MERDEVMKTPELREIVSELIPNINSVIDMGCGTGWFSGLLPSEVSYLGIDKCNDTIPVAKKRYESSTRQFQCRNFFSKDFELDKRDLAVDVGVIPTLKDPNKYFDVLDSVSNKFIIIGEQLFHINDLFYNHLARKYPNYKYYIRGVRVQRPKEIVVYTVVDKR